MDQIIKADTIEQYNRFFEFETRHPLVGIVHFDSSVPQPTHRMTLGFYALFLKKTTGCIINYGKTVYDFDDETVVSFAPGQTVGIHRLEDGPAPDAVGLLFHPDFLHRTSLGQKMKQYSFFSYASNEALHLSTEERIILQDYMEKIAQELQHPIDKFSKSLIVSNIEVLLNYCMRFYERQFVTREELNNGVLVRFERMLSEYWDSGMAKLHGLPTVKYFADKICLSPNYFGDLVKSETGKTAQEHIQLKIAEVAKSALLDANLNTKQVADMIGFQYPQHFLRFFKKQVGCTPKEFVNSAIA
ncbi:helix-turn-helix domain-containing protein [uncultured Bacteroides sp.]|uniref:helix-turn-helix domain-containing protein n=1 Tax=uncultured Bacteroides sp. TaxID=162156 RepID=UPI002615FA4C|nr:helix-turn-helix domain-containing protein [uncultured Bacteroides sp.]